jgi:hypothetical protein
MSALKVGDRVRLYGGYDTEPAWGRNPLLGTVASFIPGQNDPPAAVVKLDNAVSAEGVTGDLIVLELRYVGARWRDTGIVHIELCDFVPEAKTWFQRRPGKWIESHATYSKA